MLTTDGRDVTGALRWAASVVGPIVGMRELSGGWTSTMLALTPSTGDDVVLRLMTREPWRSHGRGLTTRESEVQGMLMTSDVPAPRSVALDPDGAACGDPAHLMTLLPGRVSTSRVDSDSLEQLADLLATIHDVAPIIDVRDYQTWAWEAKFVVPPWASDAGLWTEAFALLRTDPPAYSPCFIHRDFGLRNVLWARGRISGVVDWVETSLGPAWLDVAHCSTNIAIDHGSEAAERFEAAYVERTECEPQAHFDVMDIVGFLPPPGGACFIQDPAALRRLEGRLGSVLLRATR